MSLYHGAGLYTPTPETNHIYIYIYIYIHIHTYIYILKNNSHKGSAPTSGWLLYRTVFRKFPYPKIPHWSFRKVPVANKPACLQETFLGHLGIFFGPRGDHGELYRWDRFVETRSLVGINVSIYIYCMIYIYTHIIHTCCNYRYALNHVSNYMFCKNMARLSNDLMGIWVPWHVAVQDVMQRGDHNTRQLGTSAMKNGSNWAPQMTYWTNPFPWLHFGNYI